MRNLQKKFDELQMVYGSKELDSVYGAGKQDEPKVVFVFMNPTKRNIATDKNWKGLKAQWLGTKQIWSFLEKCGLFDPILNKEIQNKKPKEWDELFCERVYDEVKNRELWITNLAKCSQDDARPLPDGLFEVYKDLLLDEIKILNPSKIILFGNQVSSIVLGEQIKVSEIRKKKFTLQIEDKNFDVYSVFYPVGNGRFNQDKSIEDIKFILGNN